MNPGPFFSFIFFFMLILLGISSSSCGWEVLIASITDEFPRLRKKRVTVMIFSCLAAFLLGFPICFESGSLLFQLMDNRYKSLSCIETYLFVIYRIFYRRTASALLVATLLESILMSWVYGAQKFISHIKEMGMEIPKVLKFYWLTCWIALTPSIIAFISIYYWVRN